MKKATLLVLILLSGTFSLFAQNKPESGASFVVGIEGGLNGVNFNQGDSASTSGTVGFRYKMTNGITARLGLNLSMTNEETTFTGNGVENTNTFKRTGFGISLGAHKSFAGTDNLETYLGADLTIGTVGGGERIQRSEVVDSTGGIVGDYDEWTFTNPKGISIGITPFVGFQYFFVPKLAIGGEFGYGFATSNMKEGETIRETRSGSTTVTTTTESNISTKVSGLAGRGTGRVILSVYF